MMHKLRSWRQRWDPDADLVYAKRFKLGLDPENPWVKPGDPVDKSKFTLNRLKMWWKGRFIALAEEPVFVSVMYPTGRGWYAVTRPDGSVKKVRGEENAKQLCMS